MPSAPTFGGRIGDFVLVKLPAAKEHGEVNDPIPVDFRDERRREIRALLRIKVDGVNINNKLASFFHRLPLTNF